MLYCLPKSHKNDARLIGVKIKCYLVKYYIFFFFFFYFLFFFYLFIYLFIFFYLKCYSWSFVPCEPGLLVILTKGYKQSLVFRMMPELNVKQHFGK